MKKQKNLTFKEKNEKNNKFSNKGITMIALIITIIILLILAGVSIGLLTGEDGIVKKAELAKNKTDQAQVEENEILGDYENKINEIVGSGNNINRNNGNNSRILWTNDDLSTFSARTVTLIDDINNYNYYEIIFKFATGHNITNSNFSSTGLIPVDQICTLEIGLWYPCFLEVKNIDRNQLTFGNSSCMLNSGTSTLTEFPGTDSHIIPYKIIGFNI